MRLSGGFGAVLCAAVVLAGCGAHDPAPPSTATSTVATQPSGHVASWQGCTADGFRAAGAVVTRADLDGDGAPDPVRLVGAGDGPCADALVALTRRGVAGMRLHGTALDPGTARVVDLQPQLLLVAERDHPRGGHQVHLFALDSAGRLAEVEAGEGPLLPYVATDGGGAPAMATCTEDGGIAVWTATTHKPPGIVLAWDVRRTRYRIDGATAEQQGTELVKDGAPDPLLRRDLPRMFQPGTYLADCRH
jgi:hypothetical protein